ncbi:hypothetical protein FACS1894139_17230 [Planctomycetales bacterium]|nr:hypothetical protein FACS1894108_13600 [Planctomycetales bacterium]GHT08051.1 hypothetical protein FACS1894139_17230 [Planctomycetales bacterium]
MRKMHWFLTLPLVVGMSAQAGEDAPGVGKDREKNLESLLQLAVDRFQLNRYIEARAALERLIADDPTDAEAFALRNLFGERILLEMQKFGARPTLDDAERRALQLLGEANYALDRGNPEQAGERLAAVAASFRDAGYPAADLSVKYAGQLAAELSKITVADHRAIAAVAEKVTRWRERLQSIGNVPLLLLTRAQRYEQQQLRDPKRLKQIVNNALLGGAAAQQSMLDVARLGVFAVPELLDALRDERNDARRTNAHFILLTMGPDALLPLCEALKTADPLLAQQICLILGEIRPADRRAIPYLKVIYDRSANVETARSAAGAALRSLTGQDPKDLLPAADYFLREANRYYLGGDDVDRELRAGQDTFWAWDQELGDGGGLRQITVPRFALSDMFAEELTYRGLKLATDKTPFEILLASVFLQEKERVDTLDKLLAVEVLDHPDAIALKKDAATWKQRYERNRRIVYTLGAEYLTGVLEKALRDGKTEVALAAMDALLAVAGDDGWQKLENYRSATGSGTTVSGTGASGEGVADAGAASEGAVQADIIEVGKSDVAKLPDVSAPAAPAAPAEIATSAETTASATALPATALPATALPATALPATASVHPLLAALDSRNPRIAMAAANALVNLGLPQAHPAYGKLLPLLLNGASEYRSTVVEIITADAGLRQKMASEIERDQMLPLVANDGYAGYNLAVQYPPKDVILLDNRTDEFNTLRLQVELRGLSQDRILPLTIITTREHVANIANQFKNEEGWQIKEFDNITGDRVTAHRNNFFDELQKLAGGAPQTVAVVTQSSREERYKIKEGLALRAERSLRPSELTEYANVRNKAKVLGDVFGVRVTYAPVFVDDEIGGYDTMRTVQALQIDPRTRSVPIGILVGSAELQNVKTDFERFLKDGVVEILSRNLDAKTLREKIGELRAKNPLANQNYARAVSNDIATRSARALTKIKGAALTTEQERQLFAVAGDTVGRPLGLRVAATQALGHFQATSQLAPLMSLFAETDAKQVELRTALMAAIGAIDRDNQYLDFKLEALKKEQEPAVQQAIAVALGPAAQNQTQLEKYMEYLRLNDPLTLARNGDAAPAEKPAEEPADDAADEEEEEEEEGGENW